MSFDVRCTYRKRLSFSYAPGKAKLFWPEGFFRSIIEETHHLQLSAGTYVYLWVTVLNALAKGNGKRRVHPTHSKADGGVLRALYKKLQKLNADVRFTEYPNVHHKNWANAFAEPQFLSWLFSKQKN
jgi:hypothetical protein